MIKPAQNFDLALRAKPRDIARLVETRTGFAPKGIGNESLRGQLRTVPVSAGKTKAADVQFTGHAHRNGLQMRIEDIELGIGNGLANVDRRIVARHLGGDDQMVVSVGPYMFQSSPPLAKSCVANSFGSASPPQSILS